MLTLPHRSYRDDGPFQKPETELLQRSWRFCGKCAGMFWEGDFRNQRGVCPAGGEHDPWGLNFLLAVNEGPNRQIDWRFCGKCNGLFWSNADGVCPSRTGPHQIGGDPGFEGFNFALTHDITPGRTQQRNWRFCGKCGGLFFAGTAGVCPKDREAHQAGAGPGAPGHDFVLSHDPGEDPLHQENWRFCQRCFGLVYAGQYDWFGAASPVVVNTDEHRGLPPSPSGRGVVLLGFGYNPPGGYRLAWLPLPQSGPPRVQDTQYWQGAGEWSPNADNSVNLFDRKPLSYTSISLNWLQDPGVWVMLYSHATNEQALTEFEKPVVARFASTPWDLATAPDVDIFDPKRECAYGVYMNSTDGADEFDIPPNDKSKGWAYGAYLIERYTHWDPNTRELNLVYLLSLRSPYQVQLMQTIVHMTWP